MEAMNGIVPGGWSIAVEMNFYLLLPLLYWRIRNAREAAWWAGISFILGLVVSIGGRVAAEQLLDPLNSSYNVFFKLWPPAQFCLFPLGILVYFLLRSRLSSVTTTPEKTDSESRLGFQLVVLSLCAAVLLSFGPPPLYFPRYFLVSLCFVPLLIGLFYSPMRIFVNPVVCWAGKVSYGAYFIHFFRNPSG